MVSPTFPNIIEMKLKLYKLMNILISPKIMPRRSKLYVFALETSENTLFHFDCFDFFIGKTFPCQSLVLRMEYLSYGGGDISILPFAVGWMRPGGNCDERRLSPWTFD